MRARLAVVGLALVASACGGSSTGPADSNSPSSSPTTSPVAAGPPTVHEDFTPLPCDPNTTVGMQGCAEHRILRADALIDRRVRVLWDKATADARTHLADAQSAWQVYRKAACLSESDSYAGGTLAPVVAGRCELHLTVERAAELGRQLRPAGG